MKGLPEQIALMEEAKTNISCNFLLTWPISCNHLIVQFVYTIFNEIQVM